MSRKLTFRNPVVTALSMLVILLALVIAEAPALAEDDELPLRFNTIANNMSNVGPRGQARIQINVTRWTTEEERAALKTALKTQGRTRNSRELADALFEQEAVGTFRESRSIGETLRYSRRTMTEDGGQQVILATDRPLAFAEVWRSTRTTDYNVTVIMLEVDENGRGEGSVMVGADLSWDDAKDQVSITGFASEPIRLNNVRLR